MRRPWFAGAFSSRFDGLLEADERYFELHGDTFCWEIGG